MRIDDRGIIDLYFEERSKVVKAGIEDTASLEGFIAQGIRSFGTSSKPDHEAFRLCSLIHHYREIVFFSNKSLDRILMDKCKLCLTSDTISGPMAVMAHLTLALLAMPFVRGSHSGVYNILLQSGDLDTYFDGFKAA